MSKSTTNNIDVSEEIRYCNNCSNLGLDFKTGKFYCGLSNRNDELPEILSCENFSSNGYIKRLQEENEKLKNKNNDLIEEIASGNIDIAILQKENEELKAENEQLKKPCLVIPKVNQLAVPIEKYEKLYKALEEINILAKNYCNTCDEFKAKTYKALEEIRKEYTNSIFYQCDKTEEECPCHNCIILGQLDRVQNIVKIIDEVLNDRS